MVIDEAMVTMTLIGFVAWTHQMINQHLKNSTALVSNIFMTLLVEIAQSLYQFNNMAGWGQTSIARATLIHAQIFKIGLQASLGASLIRLKYTCDSPEKAWLLQVLKQNMCNCPYMTMY